MRCLPGFILLILPLVAAAEVVTPIDSVQNHVNIRMSADSQSEIVGHLNRGDYLPLVASAVEWHEVQIAGGATGFVSVDWTTVLAEPPAAISKDDSNEAEDAEEKPAIETSEVAAISPDTTGVADAAATTDSEIAPDAEPGADAEDDASAEAAAVAEVENVAAVADESAVGSIPQEPADVASVDVAANANEQEPTAEAAEDAVESEKSVVDTEEETVVAEEAVPPAAEPETSVVEAGQSVSTEAGDPAVATAARTAEPGPPGPPGPQGPQGLPGPPGAASIEGSVGFLTKFTAPRTGGSSQVFDDGNKVGIGTTEPKQRLEVNGNIQIHERNSSVAGLMITQSDGDTGYIMHNRASTLTIGAGSVDRITIDRNGNVGFGVSRPANPLEMTSGAHVTAGGVWTNSSSRDRKENISELTLEDALSTLTHLEPVRFNYKNDQSEQYVGFIAEDVPDLVATSDRDGLSAMDIVAVLTRVVQQQQKKIEELEARLNQR